jgi:hypothetical protein
MEMEMSRGWQELGVVDTIYEDDHEEEDEEEEKEEEERFDSPSLTMSSSAATSRSCSPELEEEEEEAHPSLPPALRRPVQAWYVPPAVCIDPALRFWIRVGALNFYIMIHWGHQTRLNDRLLDTDV